MVGTRGIELSMEKWRGTVDEAWSGVDRNSCLRDGSTVHECAVVSPRVTYAWTATKYSVSLRFLPRSRPGIAFCRDTCEYPWPVSFLCTFVFYGKARSILLVGRVDQSIAIATRQRWTRSRRMGVGMPRGIWRKNIIVKGEVAIVEYRECITAILYEHARFYFEQMIFRRNPEIADSLRRVKACTAI